MAKKFLYIFAAGVVLVIIAGIALSLWTRELTQIAMVPTVDFVDQEPFEENAYQDPALWYSRPGIGVNDPARWQPAMRNERGGSDRLLPSPAEPKPDFAVFFVHPTSYYNRSAWNAPLDDESANDYARRFIRGLASPFNQASEIWAPKYRQATLGAFLTDAPEAQKALDAAYADVANAFDYFVSSVGPDTPIVLVGHSQGSVHLLRLLKDEIAQSPLKDRIGAAYVIGWPISVEHDLGSLGLPACGTSQQSGCILSWSTYAEPADPSDMLEYYAASTGFDGNPRGSSPILCTNPLTGSIGGSAEASENPGTLVPDGDLENGELVPAYAPARCDERGLLMIGEAPEMGSAVLPGNNYHVYDIPLFWSAVKSDVAARIGTWHQRSK